MAHFIFLVDIYPLEEVTLTTVSDPNSLFGNEVSTFEKNLKGRGKDLSLGHKNLAVLKFQR